MSTALETQPTAVEAVMEKKLSAIDLGESTPKSGDSDTLTVEEPSQSVSIAASLREKLPGVVKTPFVDPVESTIPKPTLDLMPDQEAKYEALLEIVKEWKEIPSKENSGPLQENEIMWLTRECLLRYLRATKWHTAEAAKRLLGTLVWRRNYGTEGLSDGVQVSPENETGKQIVLGFDVAARPCLYLNPGRQNTDPSPRQVQHLVFAVERLIDLMVPGQESLALLINFKQSKTRKNTAPGLGLAREVLNILQTHYPERLGRACIINVPWVVSGFFTLITPFIDPLTREKLKFNEDVAKYVPREQLWKDDFNGDVDFEYDHDVYWPALVNLCAEKRAERKARWEKAGKRYGESEYLIKGGVQDVPVPEQEPVKVDREAAPVEDKGEEAGDTTATQVTGSSEVVDVTIDPKPAV